MMPCRCGEPATNKLYLHYRRPREQFEPLAVDPWYSHGGWPASTCGSAGCEAEVYAELLAARPGAEVTIYTSLDDIRYDVVGDEE